MSVSYLKKRLMLSIFAMSRIKLLRLSLGDGLKALPPSPIWF
jgi:hypothetical protein